MAEVNLSVEIEAPLWRVAAFFVPQRMPYWYGAEMGSCFEVSGGQADFAVGRKVRISGRVLGRGVALTVVITRCEPGRLLEWRFRDEYGIRGAQRWELASAMRGASLPERRAGNALGGRGQASSPAEASGERTLVSLHDEFELPQKGRLARLAERYWMRPNVARRDRQHLQLLKRLAERAGGRFGEPL